MYATVYGPRRASDLGQLEGYALGPFDISSRGSYFLIGDRHIRRGITMRRVVLVPHARRS